MFATSGKLRKKLIRMKFNLILLHQPVAERQIRPMPTQKVFNSCAEFAAKAETWAAGYDGISRYATCPKNRLRGSAKIQWFIIIFPRNMLSISSILVYRYTR